MQGGRSRSVFTDGPRDAGALNARRSFSHLTARNSKERSSGGRAAKGAREEEGGGSYAGGVSRVVQTGAETVFSRARSELGDRMDIFCDTFLVVALFSAFSVGHFFARSNERKSR